MELSGWGRYPKAGCRLLTPRSIDDLRRWMAKGPMIARGMGRAYGDSALNRHATIDMTRFGRMLSFDPTSGLLEVEAGVTLEDIIETFLPRGWFPPVTPGTKFVTVGGMIAADVHGKNHHQHGSFGSFIEWIDVLGPDGDVQRASKDGNSDLFYFTLGGMGLSGIIIRACFRLVPVESGWIRQETLPASSLDEVIDAMTVHKHWTYSVAWIDCLASGSKLGRSILMLGEHARRDELDPSRRASPFDTPRKRRLKVPFDAPSWLLNAWSVRAFNACYYAVGERSLKQSFTDWDSYFYPLDGLLNWNRIYGRPGFVQFQCVLPLETSRSGLRALLEEISKAKEGAFLAVLKLMGDGPGMISFPMPGYTLALDLPVNDRTWRLLERLDAIMIEHGGRSYLAKDSRMSRSVFERSETRHGAFRSWLEATGARRHFRSLQSERLGL